MAVQTCCCVSSAEAQLTHTSWVVLWSRSYKDLVCVQIKDLNLFIYQNSLICRVLLQLLRNAYDLINPVSWLKGLVWVGYLRSLLDAHFQPTSPTPSPVIEMHLTNLPFFAIVSFLSASLCLWQPWGHHPTLMSIVWFKS